MKKFLAAFLVIILLASCSPSKSPSEEGAAQALVAFFDHLNEGEYEEAVALYGGSYEDLVAMNPDLHLDDRAALWERACTQNGLQCLTTRDVILNECQGDIYFFKVSFNAPDGSLFVLGPCCGATEEQMPSTSIFDYSVLYIEGEYMVLGLPVYVP